MHHRAAMPNSMLDDMLYHFSFWFLVVHYLLCIYYVVCPDALEHGPLNNFSTYPMHGKIFFQYVWILPLDEDKKLMK